MKTIFETLLDAVACGAECALDHLLNHAHKHKHCGYEEVAVDDTIFVIAVVSNPVGYNSRYQLYRDFEQRMLHTPNVKLITVEQQINGRPFTITEADNPYHLQLMGDDRHFLWVKEGLVNAGIKHLHRLHPNWKYMAWIDADVSFTKSTWVEETIEALQHHDVVQPWSHAMDLAHNGSPVPGQIHKSFGHEFVHRCGEKMPRNISYGIHGHPGYAWAMTREACDTLDGVLDWCILGSADSYMAYAFSGDITNAWKVSSSEGHDRKALEYQAKVDKLQKGFGYVPGTICHYWHGSKATRYYIERRQILINEKFDPYTHVQLDENGIPVPTDMESTFFKKIRAYMFSRKEDNKK